MTGNAAIFLLLSALLSGFTGQLYAQQRAVDPATRYYHLICLVHVTGGDAKGPVRPEHLPQGSDVLHDGIVAWKMLLTDDGSMAIVHAVARSKQAFAAITTDKRPEIRVFEPGRDSKQTIELELRKYRKDFDLNSLEVTVQ